MRVLRHALLGAAQWHQPVDKAGTTHILRREGLGRLAVYLCLVGVQLAGIHLAPPALLALLGAYGGGRGGRVGACWHRQRAGQGWGGGCLLQGLASGCAERQFVGKGVTAGQRAASDDTGCHLATL